ncbi:serine/threonine-protein kinase [uncultured Ilumatobacter sp.]|jgi:eukaryotic-like serine/threonine-protein kinase|uniref:serine/threonine-protein kinase n=1 Tax=uncultured Ilumatobacter sp. TaxID=879968 RepID=UPI00374F3540
MSDLPSTLIAERYELKRRLAQGGMAEVWLAVDLTLDRKVAVKWLKPALASDEVVAERFRREAIAAASLNHPNIVAVHDVFEHEGRQAVVMQLVDGKSLRQLLDTQKRLSPELTGHIGACTAAALHHAHENNFVHRDVKPGNIMITADGRVLLTDFGIAKALQGGDDLTSENIMMGTAKYLSPEQVRGKKLDGRADLYSLGLVLYECLAGRVPFLGESDADTALARLQRDPTDLSQLRATLPTSLVTIIHQLLARNPMHRPATGADLVAALEQAAAEGPPEIDETPHERSTVAPFSAGRLRRAPSDLGGRADDRRRATRGDSSPHGTLRQRSDPAPSGPPLREYRSDAHQEAARPVPERRRIPGEPERITGTVPIQQLPRVPRQRDNTPHAGAQLRGKPVKGMSQGWKPSVTVIGGLLLLATIVAIALVMSAQFGSDNDGLNRAEIVVPDDSILAGGDTSTGDAEASGENPTPRDDPAIDTPVGPASIADVITFDPDGNGEENDDEAVLAISDGDASTNWRTVCYGGEYMGGKVGVGLVITLDQPAQQALTVDVINGPYIVDFYTSTAPTAPGELSGWDGQLGAQRFAAEGEVLQTDVPAAPVRHVLILLKQLGADTSCSANNPFRGRLGEIALVG